MKRIAIAAGLGLLVPPAQAPAVATQAGAAEASRLAPDAAAIEAARTALAEADINRLIGDRDFALARLAHIDLLARIDADPEFAMALDSMRLLALMPLDRPDDMRATLDRVLARRSPEPQYHGAAWWAALSIGDYGRALAVVEQASRSVPGIAWPQLREALNRDSVLPLLHHFQEARDEASRTRLAEALFRIGWPGPREREAADFLRSILLDDRLRQGDRVAASELAAGISTPSSVLTLIVQQRYDGLFPPGIDRLARFREALDDQDRHTAEGLAATPQDMSRVIQRAQLLRARGGDAEALALLQPFTRDIAATVGADEQGLWLVNEAAYALIALGRKDEAVALMGRLAALPIADNPSLISSSINYGEVLWEVGRHADSLAHAREIERDFSQFASDHGKMWIAATIVCALASLDRAGEAAPTLARMREGSDGNPAALTRAYLCLDDMAAAESLMVRRLESDQPESAVLALQDYALSRGAAQTGALLVRLQALRERPAVSAALNRIGRVLTLPVARTYWGDF